MVGKITRALQPLEVYSHRYYKERVKGKVQAEVDRLQLAKDKRLPLIRKITREVFENESPEVQAEIFAEAERQKKALQGKSNAKKTPADYAR